MREKIIMDFWYKFDDYFAYHKSTTTEHNLYKVRGDFRIYQKFRRHFDNNTINTLYKAELENNEVLLRSLENLAIDQLRIIDEELLFDRSLELEAFENFGMGILYDDVLDRQGNYRRPVFARIHMMDEGLYGYYSWHAFVRSVSLALFNTERWLQIDRYICLAAAIHSIQKPHRSRSDGSRPSPMNQKMNPSTLNNLREVYLNCTHEELDDNIFILEN